MNAYQLFTADGKPTLAWACGGLGLTAIGVEADQASCDIVVQRLGQSPLFVEAPSVVITRPTQQPSLLEMTP